MPTSQIDTDGGPRLGYSRVEVSLINGADKPSWGLWAPKVLEQSLTAGPGNNLPGPWV